MRLVLLALAAIWLPIKVGQWGGVLLNEQDRAENLKHWAMIEEGTHGLLAVTVCLPLFWNRRRAPFLIIPFLLATAPDFDHLMTAKERVQTMAANEEPGSDLEYVAMGTRGFTHSLVITYIAAGVLFLLTQRLDWAWVLAAARTSHIIRDAHTGGLAIFYPISPTIFEIDLWPYLYWHSALGAISLGVMFIYGPVCRFIRRVTRGGFGLLTFAMPHKTPPDWAGGVPVAPKKSSHRHSGHSSSGRHRHSSGDGETRHHSGGGSSSGSSSRSGSSGRSSRRSRSSHSSHSDSSDDS